MLVMFDVVVLACDVSSLGESSKCDNIMSYQQCSSTLGLNIFITFMQVASCRILYSSEWSTRSSAVPFLLLC